MGTYPVLSYTVPSSSHGQRHLWAGKHKRESRCETLPWQPGSCQHPLPAGRPAQRDGHAMASGEGWEKSADKPVNSQALPGVLA